MSGYLSADGLAHVLQRAAAAHTEYMERTGEDDEKWAQWCAEYLMNEQ